MTKTKTTSETVWISLTNAAAQLGKRYHKTRDLLLQGRLGPHEQRDGNRWFVTQAGLDAFKAKQPKPKEAAT